MAGSLRGVWLGCWILSGVSRSAAQPRDAFVTLV